LGISKQPPTTVDLFAAWIDHPSCKAFAYTVYPGTTHREFQNKVQRRRHRVISNDEHVSAVLDEDNNVALIVFWSADGGSLKIPSVSGGFPITLSADANSAIIYRIDADNVTVSDPSQTKTSLKVELRRGRSVKSLVFRLPVNGAAGSSVTRVIA